jgi:hypothetical protein
MFAEKKTETEHADSVNPSTKSDHPHLRARRREQRGGPGRPEDGRAAPTHWVIADLVGKGGHVRTAPIPVWVKATIDAWTTAAGITEGTVFRAINKAGRVWGDGMSPKVLWDLVRAAAGRAA